MKPTVLIVHDDLGFAAQLEQALQGKPYEAVIVQSSREALAILRGGVVDILVCDDRARGMSGVAVLEIAKSIVPDCMRVLLSTAESTALAAHAINKLELFRFLFKPCSVRDINSTILDALTAKRDHHYLKVGDENRLCAEVDGALNTEIDRALASCSIVYQPIMSTRQDGGTYFRGSKWVASGSDTFGYEALVRVNHPTLSTPKLLIDAVVEAGREFDLDRAVRGMVAKDLIRGGRALDPQTTIFVNLLTKSLEDPQLLLGQGALHQFSNQIVFEVSERTPLAVLDDLEGTKYTLRQQGYRLGLDDFAGGPTGLQVFGRLSPDVVRFDASLVRGIYQSRARAKTMISMMKMCQGIGCLGLAERVESKTEFDYLVDLGCELFQGFYVGRPGAGFRSVASSVDNQSSYEIAR